MSWRLARASKMVQAASDKLGLKFHCLCCLPAGSWASNTVDGFLIGHEPTETSRIRPSIWPNREVYQFNGCCRTMQLHRAVYQNLGVRQREPPRVVFKCLVSGRKRQNCGPASGAGLYLPLLRHDVIVALGVRAELVKD